MILALFEHPEGVETAPGNRVVYDLARNEAHFGGASVDGPALVWELSEAAGEGAALSAPVELDPSTGWLVRCDRIDFPPGGVAYRHPSRARDPAPALRVDPDRDPGHALRYGPGGAWFESGADPVFAVASAAEDTAFVRVLLLPAEWEGKRTIRYVDPADEDRPKLQRPTVFFVRGCRRQLTRHGGKLLVDQLVVHGADTAFCVPGESYLAVLDALHDAPIRLVTCRHEGGAANMADAYGKLTGRPGICIVTRGPGATQASVGVHTAYQDSTPLILLVGQVASDQQEREAFQEIDYRRMFGQLAKWVAQIDRADRIPEYIARAFATACSGRPGPVVLALPEDMLDAETDVADALPFRAVQPHPGAGELERLRALLARPSGRLR